MQRLGYGPFRSRHLRALLAVGVGVVLTSCVGVFDDGPSRAAGARRGPEPAGCDARPEAAPLSRLSRDQYDRTVRDLLGDTSAPARGFTDDDDLHGIMVGGPLSPLAADDLHAAAEGLADAADLTEVVRCDPRADEASCASETLAELGRRAYRRPLDDAELARLLEVFAAGREGGTFQEGIRWAISAALVSPAFLYHAYGPLGEAHAPGDPLYGYAIASRLSYFFWGTMPDEELFAAAAAGQLDTREGIGAQARRMLDDDRARESARTFFSGWLQVDRVASISKDPELYPEMSRQLARDLAASSMAFVDGTWDHGFEWFLVGRTIFVNQSIATAYDIPGDFGDELVPVTLDDGALRAGILGQPGILAMLATADQTHPIRRGMFVRERLLCQSLPSPPADVEVEIPPVTAETTSRERFSMHASAGCAACHQLMDPIGFTLERFDAMGQLRDTDNGFPIDDSGWVCTDAGCAERVDVSGPIGLAEHLGTMDATRECFAREWIRYALHSSPASVDSCELERLSADLEASDDLRELLVAIATSESFGRIGPVDGAVEGGE